MRNGTQAQDVMKAEFLSSLSQDFIEEWVNAYARRKLLRFLSSLAQDFIEERNGHRTPVSNYAIPELSSSGLH